MARDFIRFAAPADSRIISKTKNVSIKSKTFYSAPDLLGPGSKYGFAFANGVLTHTFLDVNDYHRYHSPVSGTIMEKRVIRADDAAGGVTIWDAERKKYVLNSGTPGRQSIETRACLILDAGEYGLVAFLPVGMSQASSVNYESI